MIIALPLPVAAGEVGDIVDSFALHLTPAVRAVAPLTVRFVQAYREDRLIIWRLGQGWS
jgi:hypothetical protein